MTTTQFEIDNALMAGLAYQSSRDRINWFPAPLGWVEFSHVPNSTYSTTLGFEASAFQNSATGEIVISYAGTNPTSLADWIANLTLGAGFSSSQLEQAALYYLQVKSANPTASISFTGHSLGGGLAALMGVFFDEQAITFDQAPFESSSSSAIRDNLESFLNSNGYSDSLLTTLVPEFMSYGGYGTRIGNVTGYYVEGEALQLLQPLLGVIGTQTPLSQSSAGLDILGLDLHSQTLLTAFLLNDDFRGLSFELPSLLETLFDEALYARSTTPGPNAARNFLDDLLRNQIGVAADPVAGLPAIPANAMLDRFVVDLQQLTPDTSGTAAGADMAKALTVFAMEYHYLKETGATQAFTLADYGLHFKYSDIGAPSYKSLPKLVDAVDAFLAPAERTLLTGKLVKQDVWHIQSGMGGMTVHAGAGNDAMIGGANADDLCGGGGSDILIGGADDDTLVGEAGNDYLLGGIGFDTYLINPGDGTDTLLDSDGSGVVVLGGIQAQGKTAVTNPGDWLQLDAHTWQDRQHGLLYRLIDQPDGSRDLYLNGGDSGARIKGWNPGDLGIDLGTGDTAPATHTYTGGAVADLMMNTDLAGWGEVSDSGGIHAYALPGSLNRYDGQGGGDFIQTDFVDDWVDAGAGNDFILAPGGGADILLGGAGNDLIQIGDPDPHNDGGAAGLAHIPANNRDFIPLDNRAYVEGGDGDDILTVARHYLPMAIALDGATAGTAYSLWEVAGNDFAAIWGADYAGWQRALSTFDTVWNTEGQLNLQATFQFSSSEFSTVAPTGPSAGVLTRFAPAFIYTPAYDNDDTSGHVLLGGGGNDLVEGGWGDDFIDGGEGDDDLDGERGDDVLLGGQGEDLMLGGEGNDWLDGGSEADTLIGEAGDDILHGGAGDDELNGDSPFATTYAHGDDELRGGDGDDRMWGDGGADRLYGEAGDDYLEGDRSGLDGQAHGDDVLDGGDGDDTLIAGGGADLLLGGAGNDILYGDNHPGVALDAAYQGNDTLYGGDGDDSLLGGGGDDVLIGGTGLDYLDGGTGNDLYRFAQGDSPLTGGIAESIQDEGGDDTVEFGAGIGAANLTLLRFDQDMALNYGGTDWLYLYDGFNGAIETFRFADGRSLSWLQLIGQAYGGVVDTATTAANATLAGGAQNDSLAATGGGSTFSGGQGNDVLTGAGGNNTYLYDPGDGSDWIDDTGGQTDGQGNPAPNVLRFGEGITAADLKLGLGLGSLLIRVGNNPDDAIHLANFNPDDVHGQRAIDRFEFADGTALSYEELLERGFDLQGTVGADTIIGTNVDDRIDGGAGDDSLFGGAGNDIYLFSRGFGQDVIDSYDPTAGKLDVVAFDATIAPEEMTATRSGNDLILSVDGTSDTLTILNYLENGGITPYSVEQIRFHNSQVAWDLDTVKAMLGEVPANHAPVLSAALPDQAAAQGAPFSYTFAADSFVDPDAGDALTYSATLADGSALPVWLSFDAVTRTFSGIPDVPGAIGVRVTVEDAGNLTASDVFDITVSVQNLTLNGTANADTLTGGSGNDTLNGHGGNDTLIGNAGNDVLDGGAGSDTLRGGTGDDLYVVDDAGDVVTEHAAEGIDTVQSSISYTLGAHVENLTLTGAAAIDGRGNALDNVLRGNGAGSVLHGLAGNDALYAGGGDEAHGGAGNDVLYAENSVGNISTLYGDDGDDVLNGGAGLNFLVGGFGNDIIYGGSGINLIYGDDNVGGPGGNDVILAGAGYNYVWAGAGNDVVIGNVGDDYLMGQEGNDWIYGGAGNDILNGDVGIDTLVGGTGNDTYNMNRGYGVDTVIENDATVGNVDVVQFLSGVSTDQIWFQQVGNSLEASIIGTGDKLVIQDWYLGSAHHVEQFKTTGSARTLLDSNVQNLVNAMASFAPPAAGQTTLPQNYQDALAGVIAANWQ
jgi:Ca2+-binding RTX toxin-like protein